MQLFLEVTGLYLTLEINSELEITKNCTYLELVITNDLNSRVNQNELELY